MCKYCDDIDTAFNTAQKDPHKNFMSIYELVLKKLEGEYLEVYAGDCKFKDMFKIIDAELHYTVCFYLQCKECKVLYFFGACIRGAPVYKRLESITEKEINNMLWGSEGSYFKETEISIYTADTSIPLSLCDNRAIVSYRGHKLELNFETAPPHGDEIYSIKISNLGLALPFWI